MPFLEHVAVPFFKRLSTVNRSVWSYLNRVLREQRCESGCIGLVGCIVKLLTERFKLLAYLRIDRVFFLGEGRNYKSGR
jgi:hypothetical protein